MQNYKDIIVFFLLIHIIADFYFQNDFLADKKANNIMWVEIHSLIYAFVFIILGKIICPSLPFIYLLILAICHCFIDTSKYYIEKYCLKSSWKKYVFSIDQFMHFMTLMSISYIIAISEKIYVYNPVINEICITMGISFSFILTLGLKLLMIHKPINLFIVSLLKWYKPSEKETENVKTGSMIGTLERMIMLFFLSLQQYASVGLVLTAKSIARYNKIAQDQAFAEYYLSGTLLSVICVLIVSLI